MKPFLKWAGGKSWLAPMIAKYYDREYRLVEKFAGAGAVSLYVEADRVLLNDLNPYLVECWHWFQQNDRFTFVPENTEEAFSLLRKSFNTEPDPQKFWWLNRLSHGGLPRFNKKKEYNVPYGKYKKFWVPDVAKYQGLIKNWEITRSQFDAEDCNEDDFLYLDPPYDGTFDGYTAEKFTWEDQERLAEYIQRQPCKVIVSNSPTDRIIDLYKAVGMTVTRIEGRRNSITRNVADRGKKEEILAFKGFDL